MVERAPAVVIKIEGLQAHVRELVEAMRDIQRVVDMGNEAYSRAWHIAEAAIQDNDKRQRPRCRLQHIHGPEC